MAMNANSSRLVARMPISCGRGNPKYQLSAVGPRRANSQGQAYIHQAVGATSSGTTNTARRANGRMTSEERKYTTTQAYVCIGGPPKKRHQWMLYDIHAKKKARAGREPGMRSRTSTAATAKPRII